MSSVSHATGVSGPETAELAAEETLRRIGTAFINRPNLLPDSASAHYWRRAFNGEKFPTIVNVTRLLLAAFKAAGRGGNFVGGGPLFVAWAIDPILALVGLRAVQREQDAFTVRDAVSESSEAHRATCHALSMFDKVAGAPIDQKTHQNIHALVETAKAELDDLKEFAGQADGC